MIRYRKPRQRAAAKHATDGGFTLVEVLVAGTLVVMTSLSMAYSFGSTNLASKAADRAVAMQQNLEDVTQILEDQPFEQILSWNGTNTDFGDHQVTVAANLVEVGLIMVELVVTDTRTGNVLARIATYHSGDV